MLHLNGIYYIAKWLRWRRYIFGENDNRAFIENCYDIYSNSAKAAEMLVDSLLDKNGKG